MTLTLRLEPPPRRDVARFTEEVRGAVRNFSQDQILDLADMLHDEIRERRIARARGVRQAR